MTYLKTLLVDTADLRTLTGVTVLHMDLDAPWTRRGDDEVIPRRDGDVGVQLPLASYTFTVGVLVKATGGATFAENRAALAATIQGTRGLVALERRYPATGMSPYKAMTASGRFLGALNFTMDPGLLQGVAELQFKNLNGGWWDSVALTWNP